MRSIGFTDEEGAMRTKQYADTLGYTCKVTFKDDVYFVWVNRMTIQQSEDMNTYAETLPGIVWLSALQKHYESANRAFNDLF